jgi:hypothetical protein
VGGKVCAEVCIPVDAGSVPNWRTRGGAYPDGRAASPRGPSASDSWESAGFAPSDGRGNRGSWGVDMSLDYLDGMIKRVWKLRASNGLP